MASVYSSHYYTILSSVSPFSQTPSKLFWLVFPEEENLNVSVIISFVQGVHYALFLAVEHSKARQGFTLKFLSTISNRPTSMKQFYQV